MKESEKNNPEAMEAHHRVKNSFQNIISYINILLGANDALSKKDVQKVVNYIHSLSSIHNVLFDQIKWNESAAVVQIDRVLHDLVENQAAGDAVEYRSDGRMFVTPRRAATLSLVVNELVSNALKHGSGDTLVLLETTSPGLAKITVTNRVASANGAATPLSGLRLAGLLVKSDLHSELLTATHAAQFAASCTFRLLS